MPNGYAALTEREKDALRLMVRGHDAKSAASELSLSVHTINERLRSARRKLEVTSSREAARLVFERESEREDYENLADKKLGDAKSNDEADRSKPSNGSRAEARPDRTNRIRTFAGASLMTLIIAAALALTAPGTTYEPPADTAPDEVARDHASEDAAREWLALTDASDWQTSYAATGSQFRKINTLEVWTKASQEARAPLGAVLSREAIGYRDMYAPPNGYREVQFRTDFAARKGVIETVTLEYEGDDLRVVAYIIE